MVKILNTKEFYTNSALRASGKVEGVDSEVNVTAITISMTALRGLIYFRSDLAS